MSPFNGVAIDDAFAANNMPLCQLAIVWEYELTGYIIVSGLWGWCIPWNGIIIP